MWGDMVNFATFSPTHSVLSKIRKSEVSVGYTTKVMYVLYYFCRLYCSIYHLCNSIKDTQSNVNLNGSDNIILLRHFCRHVNMEGYVCGTHYASKCSTQFPLGSKKETKAAKYSTIEFNGQVSYLKLRIPKPGCIDAKVIVLVHYRSGTVNSNTVNSKFHLIRSYCEYLARILSFHV